MESSPCEGSQGSVLQEHAFELAALPSELLDCILGNERSSFLILRLWKCGNKIMNAKLSESITYVSLSHADVSTSRYPRFLPQLRKLRHLALSSNVSLMLDCPQEWNLELAKLPASLEHLELTSAFLQS